MPVVFDEVTARIEPTVETEETGERRRDQPLDDGRLSPRMFVELQRHCERRRRRTFAD